MPAEARMRALPCRARRAAAVRPLQAGLTLVEVIVGLLLALTISLAALHLLEWSRQQQVAQNDQATAQTMGRAALDVFASSIRRAGYDPTDLRFDPVPAGSASAVRLLADLDEDGVVGSAGEFEENLSYVFAGPDGEGLYELRRGVDLNGDLDFTGTGESIAVLADHIVPVDADRDGTSDDFITYLGAPPLTSLLITVSFGVRSESQDRLSRDYTVVTMNSRVNLRNNLLQ